MFRLAKYLVLPAFLLTTGLPESARGQALDTSAIDGLVKDALQSWKVPGVAVAIVYRGRVVYLKGFGVRELGKAGRVTPDTVFPLASCTKAFTTTAMAMLVDEGKMGWDDPVRKYVPYFHLADPLADANVTLRDLVSHRTGLASHDLLWYRAPWSQEESIRRAGRLKLSKPFRSGYQYQSIMVMAAGKAVAAAAGCPWDEFVRRRLFRPLGMTGASCTTTEALKSPDHASPHRLNKRGKVEVIPWYPMTVPDPAGSINASARDLSKWVLLQLGDGTYRGKRLVSAENLAETHAPQTIMRLDADGRAMQPFTHMMSYAMGWVVQDYRGQFLVSHGGAIDGFRAHITLVPDHQLGIVLLNNLDATQMNLALSNSILDQVLHLGTTDWNQLLGDAVKKEEEAHAAARQRFLKGRHPGTRPSLGLAAYAGTYEDPAYGTAHITVKDEALCWQWSSFHGRADHFEYDTFLARNDRLGDPTLVFHPDSRGGVAGLTFLGREFKRKKP